MYLFIKLYKFKFRLNCIFIVRNTGPYGGPYGAPYGGPYVGPYGGLLHHHMMSLCIYLLGCISLG